MFLGTSGSMPTPRRAPTAQLVRRGGERLLFDCAEGTQRQLLVSAVGLIELREIFLTHYHADHYLGLPGMLKTFALRGRDLPVTIYGPPGLRDLFGSLRRIFGRLTYEYDLIELVRATCSPATATSCGCSRSTTASRRSATHWSKGSDRRFDVDVADALGVPPGPERGALQAGEEVSIPGGRVVHPHEVLGPPRPGRKLVLAGDTAPFPGVVEAAATADVLVHEATFLEDERARPGDLALHRTGRCRRRTRRRRRAPGAHTPLEPLFRPRRSRGGQGRLPGDSRAQGLRYHRASLRERGTPQLLKGGAIHRRDAPVEAVHVGEEPGS